MADKKNELIGLVGENNVFDDIKTLNDYSKDNSFVPSMKPEFVVKPKDADTIQRIVEWANRTKMTLVPVSSGPPHFHGDTVPGVPGAVVLDLSGASSFSASSVLSWIICFSKAFDFSSASASMRAIVSL